MTLVLPLLRMDLGVSILGSPVIFLYFTYYVNHTGVDFPFRLTSSLTHVPHATTYPTGLYGNDSSTVTWTFFCPVSRSVFGVTDHHPGSRQSKRVHVHNTQTSGTRNQE